jgi:hypothetical protein
MFSVFVCPQKFIVYVIDYLFSHKKLQHMKTSVLLNSKHILLLLFRCSEQISDF